MKKLKFEVVLMDFGFFEKNGKMELLGEIWLRRF
jgi:hypothetical protein